MDEATLQKILENAEKNGIDRDRILAAINDDALPDEVREMMEAVLRKVEQAGQSVK